MSILGNKKKIIVTGGAGFIGGCLIRRLLSDDELFVCNIDKVSEISDVKSLNYFSTFQKYNFYKNSLSNVDEITKIIIEINPDIIFHLAAESHVDKSIVSPDNFIQSNILGTFNLLEASRNFLRQANKEKNEAFLFYHISTDEVFGSLSEKGFFDENSIYDPRSPYSASKASSDHLVNAWHHTFGIPVLISNCSNNYGPRQNPEKLIPLTIKNAYYSREIPLYGDGLNVRDWLFVEDHIDAMILLVNKGKIGDKYCIGGFNDKPNLEVIKIICSIMDERFPNNAPHLRFIKYVEDRLGHDRRYAIDSTKIKNEIKWNPKFEFKKGIEETVDWYIKNTSWFDRQ